MPDVGNLTRAFVPLKVLTASKLPLAGIALELSPWCGELWRGDLALWGVHGVEDLQPQR
jgi:hypothetical protein